MKPWQQRFRVGNHYTLIGIDYSLQLLHRGGDKYYLKSYQDNHTFDISPAGWIYKHGNPSPIGHLDNLMPAPKTPRKNVRR